MLMAAKAFVDTNILLRALLTEIDLHTESDTLLKRLLQEETELWISGQVIREFIVQATHPRTLKIPLKIEEVIHEIRIIEQLFSITDETEAVRQNLLDLLQTFPTHGKQVHDANIVATMLANQIDNLATHNIEDFKRFSSKINLISLK